MRGRAARGAPIGGRSLYSNRRRLPEAAVACRSHARPARFPTGPAGKSVPLLEHSVIPHVWPQTFRDCKHRFQISRWRSSEPGVAGRLCGLEAVAWNLHRQSRQQRQAADPSALRSGLSIHLVFRRLRAVCGEVQSEGLALATHALPLAVSAGTFLERGEERDEGCDFAGSTGTGNR